jgi:hypothetical protein
MAGMEYNLHNFGDEIYDEALGDMMDRRRKIAGEAGGEVVKKVVEEIDYTNFFTEVYEACGIGFLPGRI